MSNFYGTVYGSRGPATCTGGREEVGITAAAQSYDASVITRLYGDNGTLMIELGIADCSTADMPYYTWVGTLDDFRNIFGL